MSSNGQWEVVGKSKKVQNGKTKAKDDEKKSPKIAPKQEDVCKFIQMFPIYICGSNCNVGW